MLVWILRNICTLLQGLPRNAQKKDLLNPHSPWTNSATLECAVADTLVGVLWQQDDNFKISSMTRGTGTSTI